MKVLRIYQQADKVYILPRETPQFSRTAVCCLACRGTCTTVDPTPVTTAARAKSGQTVWRVSRAAVPRSTLGRCASRPSAPALPTPATTAAPAPRWPVRVSVCCSKELRLWYALSKWTGNKFRTLKQEIAVFWEYVLCAHMSHTLPPSDRLPALVWPFLTKCSRKLLLSVWPWPSDSN